ncbi:hypothetical protein CPB83DRAFT_906566 [Crepidotus variabilis]|uniref:Uncharacterized protein n=1 Tax=Crepidotus variabilis TaxID=179855 RepID=A0A9P6EH50_9AGAR|nr:hypothetical protein CPB83DRAFT_906566 [Crepidotus variabilis]
MTLPSELHDLIIDQLAVSDPDSGDTLAGSTLVDRQIALASCLMVSHSFRERSLLYLFKVLKIKGSALHVIPQVILLIAILEGESCLNTSSMPPASQFIQEFHLAPEGVCFKDLESAKLFSTLLRLIWTRMKQGFGPKKFVVSLPRTIWNETVPSLKDEMTTLAQSPHLKHLDIKELSLIPPSLIHESHIIGLSLTRTRYWTKETIPLPTDLESIRPPQLTQLECCGFIPELARPEFSSICKTLFAKLKSFRWISLEFQLKNNLKQILLLSASSLEKLDINCMFYSELDNIENLAAMVNLQRLRLEIHYVHSGSKLGLENFFNIKTPASKLQNIHFTFKTAFKSLQNRDGSPFSALFELKDSCQFLDHSLSSLQYPVLREVLVAVKVGYLANDQRSWSSAEDIRFSAMEELCIYFPRLIACTRIRFIPIVTFHI